MAGERAGSWRAAEGERRMAISVIVPVRENRAVVERFLESAGMTLNRRDVELILVLNRPDSDGLLELLGRAGRAIHAPSPSSPYSARNRGLEVARGEHAAFLDITCLPDRGWLDAGLARLRAGEDVVAGRVEFRFAKEVPTASELWDSVTNVQQERAVARGVAKTANLFVSGRALGALGPFREGVRSGEDVRWTGQSAAHGIAVSYCPEAVVYKQARPFGALLRKALRVGAGQAAILSPAHRLVRIVGAGVIPPPPGRVLRALRALSRGRFKWLLAPRIAAVGWCVQVAQGVGLLCPARFRRAD